MLTLTLTLTLTVTPTPTPTWSCSFNRVRCMKAEPVPQCVLSFSFTLVGLGIGLGGAAMRGVCGAARADAGAAAAAERAARGRNAVLRPRRDAELHAAALEARGSADAALEARHRSPLYRHVPVEPQLHEAGLQVGVRHVQQHLYAARGKAASQRAGDAALPARQSGTVEAPLFWPPELHNT